MGGVGFRGVEGLVACRVLGILGRLLHRAMLGAFEAGEAEDPRDDLFVEPRHVDEEFVAALDGRHVRDRVRGFPDAATFVFVGGFRFRLALFFEQGRGLGRGQRFGHNFEDVREGGAVCGGRVVGQD